MFWSQDPSALLKIMEEPKVLLFLWVTTRALERPGPVFP